ncbi:uncharacterized protein LOC132058427 [Lycium ferocissimum]|uniref:uncharacterized protein LOC132058427 n=1 Tax=Lycium ferocissimum TaxID=112874 RepID=UPI002814C233|nr:uncharacterized protein LOC132058427 [Lycium ferocissimum]
MEDGISDIANFGFSNSRGQEVEEENQENVGEISEESKGEKGKEEGGGIINHIISNLMSPRAGEARNKERNDLFDVKDENKKEDTASKVEEKSGNESGGGGIINNLISNIFHPTESSVENQENNSTGQGQKDEMKKTEEESGSVLDNIVSHLPTPLPDDAVPATDEASILIHSIVHD